MRYFSLMHLCLALPLLCGAWPASADLGEQLREALRKQDLPSIEDCIVRGASPDTATSAGKTALMFAARAGREPFVRELLQRGADVNARNSNDGTPLMYAAVGGDEATLRLLVERGARLDLAARNGWTALMVAVAKGHEAAVQLLLESGADPNLADVYGWTPLMRSAHDNRLRVAKLLLRSSRTVLGARDEHGATALHHAALQGHVEMTRLLLEAGANPSVADLDGNTPSEMARVRGHPEVVAVLDAQQP